MSPRILPQCKIRFRLFDSKYLAGSVRVQILHQPCGSGRLQETIMKHGLCLYFLDIDIDIDIDIALN